MVFLYPWNSLVSFALSYDADKRGALKVQAVFQDANSFHGRRLNLFPVVYFTARPEAR